MLTPGEPLPYEAVHVGERPVVVVCDHAGNRVPRALGRLGLEERRFADHIAWDIGAASVARRLIEALDARGVLGVYSRLVVDLNRHLDDATAFPPISDGVLVPANLGLSRAAKAERARALYEPYHRAVRHALEAAGAGASAAAIAPTARAAGVSGTHPVLVAVHSFTPRVHGVDRPWHIGVLWDKDPRLALPLLAALRAEPGVVVGDNEPYSGRHAADYTVDHHAEAAGIAHASIEIRQDLIRDEAGAARWAERLGEVLGRVLAEPSLYRHLDAARMGPAKAAAQDEARSPAGQGERA